MYDELIKELRQKHKAYVITGNAKTGQIFLDAADAIEELICEVADEHNTRLDAADAIEELKKAVLRLEDESGLYDELPTFYIYPTKWIRVADRLPEDENRKYLIAMSSVTKPTTTLYDICWFAKDLYKVDRFDFPNEKNKPGFYEYDSEYGFIEKTSVTHWMPLPEPPKEGE